MTSPATSYLIKHYNHVVDRHTTWAAVPEQNNVQIKLLFNACMYKMYDE